MAFRYRAAVLHAPQTPLSVETVTAAGLKPTDVLVRMINDGSAALKQGKTIRSVIAIDCGWSGIDRLAREILDVVDQPIRRGRRGLDFLLRDRLRDRGVQLGGKRQIRDFLIVLIPEPP